MFPYILIQFAAIAYIAMCLTSLASDFNLPLLKSENCSLLSESAAGPFIAYLPTTKITQNNYNL